MIIGNKLLVSAREASEMLGIGKTQGLRTDGFRRTALGQDRPFAAHPC